MSILKLKAKYLCLNPQCSHLWEGDPGPTNCPKCDSLWVKWENYEEWRKWEESTRHKGDHHG